MPASLNQLLRPEPAPEAVPRKSPTRRSSILTRDRLAAIFPWSLVAGFLGVTGVLFGDRIWPARSLEMDPVVTVAVNRDRTEGVPSAAGPRDPYAGETLFQASGWIEADPLPIRATTLYSGVVASVAVLEGESVEAGQLLATMVDEDARLDVETARANLAIAESGLARIQSDLDAIKAGLETLDREIAAARGRLAELEADAAILNEGGPEAFTGREIAQVALRVETQRATIAALQSRREERVAEQAARRARVAEASAVLRRSRTDLARADLALERTRIHSPIRGVIQRLFAAPGRKRMLTMDDPESATIAILFQPDALQARIDVPLEEAARVRVGQAVRLRSTLLPDQAFRGEVTRIEGQADLQRNTLQVKVRILDPVVEMRPEMLCRGEFLAIPAGVGNEVPGSAQGGIAIYVSETALQVGPSDTWFVWTLDASGGRVERRPVVPGAERRDGYRRVLDGLRPGDRVVADPPPDLRDGERVRSSEPNLS